MVLIALPIVTPAEFKNTSSFALKDFVNREHILAYKKRTAINYVLVSSWSDGFAFILSFQAPAWTICRHIPVVSDVAAFKLFRLGSFDSSVHISEEASNAATAVPWAIVLAIAVGGVLGWGMFVPLFHIQALKIAPSHQYVLGFLHGNGSPSPP